MYGWEPEPFDNKTDLIAEMKERGAPTEGAENFQKDHVLVTCQGLVRSFTLLLILLAHRRDTLSATFITLI